MSASHKCRARPDWAYEFPDRTGPDTQICRTGPAGPDWIRTYTFQHFTYQLQVIYSHIWCHKLLNLISKQKKKNLKFFFEKEIWFFFFDLKFFWFFFLIFSSIFKSGVREGKRPVSRQSGFRKFAGLPDRTWCPVEPYCQCSYFWDSQELWLSIIELQTIAD